MAVEGGIKIATQSLFNFWTELFNEHVVIMYVIFEFNDMNFSYIDRRKKN